MKDFAPGRWIVYERVPDYWGDKLPVNIGQNNFAEMRFDYFRDSTVLGLRRVKTSTQCAWP